MVLKTIYTKKSPEPVGPYSQAIQFQDLLFCSGQIPLDPQTNEIVGKEIQGQTKQVMENIKSFLESQNLDFNSIIKTTIFVKNMDDFSSMNEIYASYFSDHKPARSCVEVARLPKDVLVEIEILATTSK